MEDKGSNLQERALKFLQLFGIACLVMMVIRMLRFGLYNPMEDRTASMALVFGLLSIVAGQLLKRFFKP